MNDLSEKQEEKRLEVEIGSFVQKYQRLHLANFRANVVFVLIGLLLSAAVTVASIFNQGIVAAILGVCIALVLGVQNAFPIGEKAEFYQLIVSEGQNLISDLDYKVKTDAEFKVVLNKFKKLRRHAAASSPRGKGMDAVREMYLDLSKTVGES